MDLAEFHKILSHKFSSSSLQEKREELLRYGIVGLHTCGDLGRRSHVVGLRKIQCFGSGSVLDSKPDPYSESGSRRAKITHKSRKKFR